MSKRKKKKAVSISKSLQRKLAIQQGYYDGRFREKKIKDKKKESKKLWARKKGDE